MKIFVINGVGGSGKDTFVRACDNEIPCALTSTIDNIKLMLKSAGIYIGDFTPNYGWINEIKGPKERKLLSSIKNILTNYNDFSMKSLAKNIYNLELDGFVVIFIMVREFDEMIRIVNAHQAKTILIKSNRIPICETEQSFLDQIPKDYVWDYTFSNNDNKLSFTTKAKEWLQNEVLKNE
jgi:hypothetical protein